MRGRLVEDRIEERICKIRVIDGVIANYYPQEALIRCKDCKFIYKSEDEYWCGYSGYPTEEDGFCHNAERKRRI